MRHAFIRKEKSTTPRSGCHCLPDPYFVVYHKSHSRNLPHIHAYGAIYHGCFRLFDSMPQELLAKWRQQLDDYMTMITSDNCLNNNHHAPHFGPTSLAGQFYLFSGVGECILRDVRFAQVVWDSLWFRDEKEYCLHAVAIMPNHVHVIVEPIANFRLSNIVRRWKSFTAYQINLLRGSQGTAVWLPETYDHIIRSDDAYRNQVNYVVRNPVSAGLSDWPWVWPKQELPAPVDDWPQMPGICQTDRRY